jgi:hypothetical protein
VYTRFEALRCRLRLQADEECLCEFLVLALGEKI